MKEFKQLDLFPLSASIFLSTSALFLSLSLLVFINVRPVRAITCNFDTGGITHGPRVGAVNHNSAKIWVRSCEQLEASIELKRTDEDWSVGSVVETSAQTTDSAKDNTVVIKAENLEANSEYDYRVKTNGELPTTSLSGRFKTLPPQNSPSKFSFVIAPDMHMDAIPTFHVTQEISTLMSKNPLFTIMNGDNVSISGLPEAQDSVEDYRDLYKGSFSKDNLPQFFANHPTVMVWDDHEIDNDWDKGTQVQPYPRARQAYDEYVNSVNPDSPNPEGVYYTFNAGQVGFFVLDTRSFRSLGEAADDANKTMLGQVQKDALKNWLLTSPTRFKFLISSVMWNDFSTHTSFGESWPAYSTERNEIFNFIRDNKVAGVILVSGDEHWPGVFKIAPWDIYEVMPDPLSWALFMPTVNDPQILFKWQGKRVFGQFDVDTESCPGKLTLRIINATDNVSLYELTLTEFDLKGDFDGDGLLVCQEQQAGTNPLVADTDRDGCSDGRELGPDPLKGGKRNPTYFWDYGDMPIVGRTPLRDKRIRTEDISAVVQRYSTNDNNGSAIINRYSDPLSTPPPTGYHPAFDRGGTLVGDDPWDIAPPNGSITISDVLFVVNQYFHDCI